MSFKVAQLAADSQNTDSLTRGAAMPLISWQANYSVGVPAMDAQHQKLIAMVNALHEAMGAGHGNDALAQVLEALVAYTRVHFRAEEKLMADMGYPDLVRHREMHETLIAQVAGLHADLQHGKAALSVRTMHFLKDWLAVHIVGEDKRYGAFQAAQKAA